MNENAEKFMREAIKRAKMAAAKGEVPVGAVIVRNGEIIAGAYNTRETGKNALCHAEIKAIHKACRKLGGWRLPGCELYVTLEPCPMCTGAILHARIPRIVCGAADPIAGAMGSVWALHRHPVENKHTAIEFGCLEEECRKILQEFFRNRRDGRANK